MNRTLLLLLPIFFLLSACWSASTAPTRPHCVTPTCGPCGCPPGEPEEQRDYEKIQAIAQTKAWETIIAETTRLALSATPTPPASRTPTVTPTSTPRPTSTLWRLEPSVTPVARLFKWQSMLNQNAPPDFELGQRYTAQNFSSEQKRALHLAILEAHKKAHSNIAVDTYFFDLWDALQLDWDKDGQTETALLYSLGKFPVLGFGLAILREEQVLAIAPDWFSGELADHFLIRAVPIAPDKTALFVQLLTYTSGSGAYPRIYQRMYLLRNEQLQTIWQWGYSGGGRAGWNNSRANFERIRFLRLSGQPEYDLLLARVSSEWAAFDNPANYLFYSVRLPGELLFSWDDPSQTYRLTHFYDGARLQPIRPVDFIVHAPRIHQPLTLDGRFDWYQVEYSSLLDGYGWGNWRRSPGVYDIFAAFDDSYLYLNIETNQKTSLYIGLDTDLTGDGENPTLNEDDLLFEITLSQSEPPNCRLAQASLVWPRQSPIEAVSRPQEYWDAFCSLELRIPLAWLRLKLPLVSYPGYALRPQTNANSYAPYSGAVFTEYYPAVGQLIGFAIIGENQAAESINPVNFLPFQPRNPLTWGTLLFIADR